MKLKKIASLMLAGVMAVSMLAGCGESSSSSSESTTPPTTTVTTGIADAVNAVRSTREKNTLNLTYTESSSLAELLQVVAQDAYSKNSDAVKTAGGADGYADGYGVAKYVATTDSMYKKISDKLTGGAVAGGYDAINDTVSAKGTHKYVRMYTVGGNYSIEAAGNMVATMDDQGLHEVAEGVNTSGAGTTADYAADIAAVKVTSNVDSKVSAWVIAVVYTQTVTAA